MLFIKMFHWAKNTGFRCEDARDKVSRILEKIVESKTVASDDITVEYLTRKFIKTGLRDLRCAMSPGSINQE